MGTPNVQPQLLHSEIGESRGDLNVPELKIVQGESKQPETLQLKSDSDDQQLIYCHRGSAILTKSAKEESRFLAHGSATFLEPGGDWQLRFGRGQQFWTIWSWKSGNSFVPDLESQQTLTFLVSNCSDVVVQLTERLIARIDEVREWPNFTLAWLNMLVHEAHVPDRTFALTPIFRDRTDSVDDLIATIKANPQRAWNLSEAAKLAGYSPFHLSRVFRAVVQMGFPEFVDRCRTEIAIADLVDTIDSLTTISERSGFGTPQAMRNACREYSGFLPSEFRSQAEN